MSQQVKQASERAKTNSGRAWTDEEKDLVWEHSCKAKINGQPLTEAFRQVSRLLPHRSEAAVGMLYYNVLKKERDEDEVIIDEPVRTDTISTKESNRPKPKANRELRIDPELAEAFQGLPEYIHQLHNRLERLESQISEPSAESIAKGILHLSEGYKRVEKHKEELAQMEKKINELEQQNKVLTESLQKMQKAYDDALGIYDMFTNMASISQIMNLGDFKQQMKTTLDKWGNVLNVSFERANQ